MRLILLVMAGISLTVLCWGMYGPVLHRGQYGLQETPGAPEIKDRLKPLICVGAAYFIVAIIVPVVLLTSRGELGGGARPTEAVGETDGVLRCRSASTARQYEQP